MKLLPVPEINEAFVNEIDTAAAALDPLPHQVLNHIPWKQYPYKPDVQFRIAHGQQNIVLRFAVVETTLRAAVSETNGNVWEDSCVEMFIGFDEKGYYNIECNAIGTIHAAFGAGRIGRRLLDPQLIRSIRRQSLIRQQAGSIQWQLTLVIPATVFVHHNQVLKGTSCRANFYKCGDLLPEPHFVSWTEMESVEPDFHQPQFFGTLQFT